MKRLISALIYISLVSIASHAQNLQPGLWKAKSQFKLNGVPLPSSEDEDCIKPSQTRDAQATIRKELQKHGCRLDSWVVKNQNLEASLTCQTDEIDAKGKLHGKFTNKSYNLNGEAQGTYQNVIPSKATVTLTGQWVRTCQ